MLMLVISNTMMFDRTNIHMVKGDGSFVQPFTNTNRREFVPEENEGDEGSVIFQLLILACVIYNPRKLLQDLVQ